MHLANCKVRSHLSGRERGEDLFVSGVSLAAGENKWGPFLKSKQVNSQNLHSPSNFPNIYCKNLVKLLKVLGSQTDII